jgi:hypothetical protein
LLAAIYAVQALILSDSGIDELFFDFGFIPLRYARRCRSRGRSCSGRR